MTGGGRDEGVRSAPIARNWPACGSNSKTWPVSILNTQPAKRSEPFVEAVGDERELAEVLELDEHVLLDRRGEALVVAEVRVTLAHDRADALGLIDPPLHEREVLDALRIEQRAHRAAERVAADDDVLHAEHLDRVLDGRRRASGQRRVGDDVADVAHQKEVPGLRVRDQVRHDARVAARDEERLGVLSLRELREELFVGREVLGLKRVDAKGEFLHVGLGMLS